MKKRLQFDNYLSRLAVAAFCLAAIDLLLLDFGTALLIIELFIYNYRITDLWTGNLTHPYWG